MNPSVDTPFVNQRVIPDRRSHPTSFMSVFKFCGRRIRFRRKGQGQNQYVDRLSFRTILLTFVIFTFSSLDAVFTLVHLEKGATELNPLIEQIVLSGSMPLVIVKSVGVGLIACFLAIHQNFKISFYGMHFLAAIYTVLFGYHLMCSYLFQAI